MEKISPTVFISYSWDNEQHTRWVKKLAYILMKNEVDVLLDQYQVFIGSQLDTYMRRGLSQSRWIICICSDGYISRMTDPSTGVGKETQMINEFKLNEFILPILKTNSNQELPEHMLGKFYYDFDNNDYENGINEILEIIFGIKKEIAPINGKNPFIKTFTNDIMTKASISESIYHDPNLSGTVNFDYSNNNHNFTIGSGEFSFTTHWSKASNHCIHAYNYSSDIERISLAKNIGNLKNFKISQSLDFTSLTRTAYIGDAIIWINKFGNMAITKIIGIKDDSRGDEKDELILEYIIFLSQQDALTSHNCG